MPNPFCHYQLRSTDVEGARAFYAALFGADFWNDVAVAPLPAAAVARGVPGYWLGHIGVDDVVPPLYRFLEAGAKRLGAPPPDGRDDAGVVLNDPFGAKLALMPSRPGATHNRVAWHLLSARDEVKAFELYSTILGWTPLEYQDLGAQGRHMTFNGGGSPRQSAARATWHGSRDHARRAPAGGVRRAQGAAFGLFQDAAGRVRRTSTT